MKRVLIFAAICLSTSSLSAQDIQLPTPQKTGGKPLMEAINLRQSNRTFVDKDLDNQTLANLMWSAYGFNRNDKRVVPSANNKQEFSVFIALKSGVYLYDASANKLIQRLKGDHRSEFGKQDFVAKASANLAYVADLDKADGNMARIDCGFIAQNVYLFCASSGLSTVARGYFDQAELKKLLNLDDKQEVILCQSVGFSK
ncbi:MAG: SagB/ThcOx family dehydrogenase [Prevotellaceae bacterium]|jgi:nitroreductase|nr:SagB/ThcOx family dehydrogenase [Prevotellaceae bacterium]